MTDETDRINRATAAALWGTRNVDRDELMDEDEDEREERAVARGLFSHPEQPDEPQTPADTEPGNHVAREGGNPGGGSTRDHEERAFMRELFGYDPA